MMAPTSIADVIPDAEKNLFGFFFSLNNPGKKLFLNNSNTFSTTGGSWISRLSRMIGKNFNQKFVLTFLKLIYDGVVQRILVLFKPSGNVI